MSVPFVSPYQNGSTASLPLRRIEHLKDRRKFLVFNSNIEIQTTRLSYQRRIVRHIPKHKQVLFGIIIAISLHRHDAYVETVDIYMGDIEVSNTITLLYVCK